VTTIELVIGGQVVTVQVVREDDRNVYVVTWGRRFSDR
jgi:hypothetical protein